MMIFNIFLTGFFAVACAQEIYNNLYVEILNQLIEEGKGEVSSTLSDILNSPKEFDSCIEDRLNSLKWESTVQYQNLNKTVAQAVIQGMLKNKQFTNFQCISKETKEATNKLLAISNQIVPNTENIKGKDLTEIMSFLTPVIRFNNYLDDLYKNKIIELNKAENETARKKILEDVQKKIKHLKFIMDKFKEQVKTILFAFFEKYVDFAFKTEKNLRETQKNGSNAIMRCV